MKSEEHAQRDTHSMLDITLTDAGSVRLDQYYCTQYTLDGFSEGTKVFIIPRSSTTIRGPPAWRELIGRLMDAPMEFLSEYHRREN